MVRVSQDAPYHTVVQLFEFFSSVILACSSFTNPEMTKDQINGHVGGGECTYDKSFCCLHLTTYQLCKTIQNNRA